LELKLLYKALCTYYCSKILVKWSPKTKNAFLNKCINEIFTFVRWPRRDIIIYILHFRVSTFSTFAFPCFRIFIFSCFRIFNFCIFIFPHFQILHFHIFIFSYFHVSVFSYFRIFVFSCFHILYCCNFHTIFFKKFLHCYSLYWHRLYII
jgi:hypothetical protein